jgi:DNA-directed RNA polymerase subunit RPC12/RpoP
MNPEDMSVEELEALLARKKQVVEEPKQEVGEDFYVSVKHEDGDRRKRPVVGGENTWEDTGEHKDIETPDVAPTPRNRPPAKKIKRACHICGKKFEIDPSLVSGEYVRCNTCTGR